MPYAILRFEKRRGRPASALEKHHERKKQQYASNPDIDTERSEMFSSCAESQKIARPWQAHRDMLEAFINREQNSGMAYGSMSL